MKKKNYKPKNYKDLELTKNENFIDGRMDIFDLLAASAPRPLTKPNKQKRPTLFWQ